MEKGKTKRLYRSEDNKIFAGVIGGLGEYFGIDPVLLRVILLLIVIFTGIFPGVVVYLFAVVIIPKKSDDVAHNQKPHEHKH